MNATEFLMHSEPGFADLSEDERNAIRDFAFLWSAAEWRVLGGSARPDSLVAAGVKLTERGILEAPVSQAALVHFKDRYFKSGAFTKDFNGPFGLKLREADRPKLVEGVIRGDDHDPENMTAALLLIVYRLRNNLFHGHKWAYGISGQLENFTHANNLLMETLKRA